jgi:hypothetical protein
VRSFLFVDEKMLSPAPHPASAGLLRATAFEIFCEHFQELSSCDDDDDDIELSATFTGSPRAESAPRIPSPVRDLCAGQSPVRVGVEEKVATVLSNSESFSFATIRFLLLSDPGTVASESKAVTVSSRQFSRPFSPFEFGVSGMDWRKSEGLGPVTSAS